MKKTFLAVFIFFSVFLSAQSDILAFRTRYGLGITFGQDIMMVYSYDDYYNLPLSFGNILIPIDMSPKLRFEPELGYFLSKSNGSSHYNLRFGLGVFSIKSYERSRILIGGRAGFSSYHSEHSSSSDYYFGFATGGEYMLSNHLSIGGEVQLNYIIPEDSYFTDDLTLISTRGMVILRFYY